MACFEFLWSTLAEFVMGDGHGRELTGKVNVMQMWLYENHKIIVKKEKITTVPKIRTRLTRMRRFVRRCSALLSKIKSNRGNSASAHHTILNIHGDVLKDGRRYKIANLLPSSVLTNGELNPDFHSRFIRFMCSLFIFAESFKSAFCRLILHSNQRIACDNLVKIARGELRPGKPIRGHHSHRHVREWQKSGVRQGCRIPIRTIICVSDLKPLKERTECPARETVTGNKTRSRERTLRQNHQSVENELSQHRVK